MLLSQLLQVVVQPFSFIFQLFDLLLLLSRLALQSCKSSFRSAAPLFLALEIRSGDLEFDFSLAKLSLEARNFQDAVAFLVLERGFHAGFVVAELSL